MRERKKSDEESEMINHFAQFSIKLRFLRESMVKKQVKVNDNIIFCPILHLHLDDERFWILQ